MEQDWITERQKQLARIKELEVENAKLRKRLGEDVMPIEKKPTAMQSLSLQEKVDLYRSHRTKVSPDTYKLRTLRTIRTEKIL